jgi:hypothetical protein
VDPFHQRLASVALTADQDLGLVLAGGYAISAHGLTSRPSHDLDFATRSAMPMAEVTSRLAGLFRDSGCEVTVIEVAPLTARLMIVSDGQSCEIDLLKGPIGSPALLAVGPVLALDDAVGMKVAMASAAPCSGHAESHVAVGDRQPEFQAGRRAQLRERLEFRHAFSRFQAGERLPVPLLAELRISLATFLNDLSGGLHLRQLHHAPMIAMVLSLGTPAGVRRHCP